MRYFFWPHAMWVCIHKHVRARVPLCACMHAHVHACVCAYVGACVCMRADGSTFVRACMYMYILISKVTSVRKSNNLPCVLFSKLNLLRWNHCVNMPVQFKQLQAPLYIVKSGVCRGMGYFSYFCDMDFGCSLEPPHWGGSDEPQRSVFGAWMRGIS